MGLKSRRTRDWPVIEGEPTKPYVLPDDPPGNAAHLANMAEARTRRRERERTAFGRGARAASGALMRRHGGEVIFRRVLFARWGVEVRRSEEDGCEYRLCAWREDRGLRLTTRWMLVVNLWRQRGH